MEWLIVDINIMFVMVFVAETIIISVMVSIVCFFQQGRYFQKGYTHCCHSVHTNNINTTQYTMYME